MADAEIDNDNDGVEDIRFAITQFSFWIANADVKAGLLATATTLLTAGLVSQKSRIIGMFPLDSGQKWFAELFLLVGVVSLIIAIGGLFQTLRPRRQVDQFSRYSWVSVASVPKSELASKILGSADRADAIATAAVLARIVKAKVDALAAAALAWLISALSLFLWFFIAP